MDRRSYGTDRWKIVCGHADTVEDNAVEMLYGGVSKEVPYVLVCERAGEDLDVSAHNLIVVGTRSSNALLNKLPQSASIPEDGYTVQVGPSPFSEEKQIAVIAGSSPAQTLYAVSHFLNRYLPLSRQNSVHNPYFVQLFSGKMKEYQAVESPAFSERGIWTWGHCIYDYRRFARNMAQLGLNAITIWNDHAPINLREVISHFHSYGIKVYVGYSWGWEESVDIGSEADLQRWREIAVRTYEGSYADVGADGLYFQSFTETNEEDIDGVSIAAAVTKWVNTLGGAMLERWPDLDIRFGLHATSVKNRLDDISGVDPRISIHWEDCGAFPYAYFSRLTEGEAEMLAFTEKIAALRPGCKNGVVLKGQICLDWSAFENQKGPFLLGCESDDKIENRLAAVRRQWHDVQSYWLQNIGQFRRTLERLPGAAIYALVEDGLLEAACWYPVALYAGALWDTACTDAELLRSVAGRADTILA